MKFIPFDILFIIAGGAVMLTLIYFGLFEGLVDRFIIILMIICYQIGRYAQKKYGNKATEKQNKLD